MTIEWTFTDAEGQTYTADSVDIGNGEPLLKRGQEIDLPFNFDLNAYERLLSKYEEYLTPTTVQTTNSYNGVPRYTENKHPASNATSYVFKLQVGSDLEYQRDWWVLVLQIEDNTVLRGPIQRLTMQLYPLKPDEGETRDEIVTEYEV